MKHKRLWLAVLALIFALSLLPRNAQAQTVSYYGRQALSQMDNGKYLLKAYDAVALSIGVSSASVNLRHAAITLDELALVMDAYERDHPEHFWYGGYKANYNSTTRKVTHIDITYLLAGAALEQAQAALEERVQTLLSGITGSMTDYEKELYLHDALAKQVSYGEGNYVHNAYGALVEGVAVCDGYAKALQLLLQRAGIPSFLATGRDTATDTAHAWNYVQLDGSWYHTDLTWNDQPEGLFHAYFNMSDAMLSEDHTLEQPGYGLPACTDDAAHYFRVNDTRLRAETYADISALLKQTPWKAAVYITDDVQGFLTWLEENIHSVMAGAGAADIVSYSARQMGREVQLQLTCGHSALTRHGPVAGDCLTPGNELYYSCDACGCLFGADQATPLEQIPYLYPDHTMEGGLCAVCQVVTADGIHYPSLEQAAAAGGTYIRVNFDLDENATLSDPVYLDLNGKCISGDITVGEGATLHLFDSATAQYDATYRGMLTGKVTGHVAASCNTPASYGHNYKYLTLVEADGSVSAHRYYLAVRSVYLTPWQETADHCGSAVNYSAVLRCSDFLAAHITDWGIKLTGEETVYAEAGVAAGGQNACKTALVDTLKDTNSEEQNIKNAEASPIAQGYFRLLDGAELVSAGVQMSVKDLVTYAATADLTPGQTQGMQKMYRLFAYILDRWNLDLSKFQ